MLSAGWLWFPYPKFEETLAAETQKKILENSIVGNSLTGYLQNFI